MLPTTKLVSEVLYPLLSFSCQFSVTLLGPPSTTVEASPTYTIYSIRNLPPFGCFGVFISIVKEPRVVHGPTDDLYKVHKNFYLRSVVRILHIHIQRKYLLLVPNSVYELQVFPRRF